jgi:hypothetical protein
MTSRVRGKEAILACAVHSGTIAVSAQVLAAAVVVSRNLVRSKKVSPDDAEPDVIVWVTPPAPVDHL